MSRFKLNLRLYIIYIFIKYLHLSLHRRFPEHIIYLSLIVYVHCASLDIILLS